MTSYDELQAYQKRLRTTIFHSADVLSEQVATYLRDIAARGSYREIEQALETYRPLVDHLATAYVDFALEVLVMKPRNEDQQDMTRWTSMLRTYHDNLGIRERIRCFPPAHVQGPFLYLLHRDEREGLRLIQSLTNTAVEVWRERERDFYFHGSIRTPLPVVLTLPTGPHTLWGDERVYCWYRSSSNGPDIVISALMALEVWLEEQVIAGRKPEELFERVLIASNCVAVAGICLSVALAFPEQCLTSALPLMASPVMWRLDWARAAQDRRLPLYILLHEYRLINEAVAERNQRPQRPRTLPFLAGYYLFADDPLKTSFEQAVAHFHEHLPFLFEEERDDPEFVSALINWVEQIQVYGDRANYRQQQVGGQVQIEFDLPPSPSQQDTEQSESDEPPAWHSIALWVQQTLQEGKQAEGLTAVEAISAIREIQEQSQNQLEREDEQVVSWLAHVVAAAALIADFWDVQAHGLIPWCREHLLTAVRQEAHEAYYYAYPAYISNFLVIFAVKGLMLLVARGMATEEVREILLRLAASPYEDVMAAILQRLDTILVVDEALCWTVLSLVLSLRLIPRQLAVQALVKLHNSGEQSEDLMRWEEEVVQTHLRTVEQQDIPVLPRVPADEDMCFLWDRAKEVLDSLPLAALCAYPDAKARLLGLVSDLLAWTIAVNTSSPEFAYVYRDPHPPRPHQWNKDFILWVVRMMDALSQQEQREAILGPLLEHWSSAPLLLKDLVYSYTRHYLSTLGPLSSSSVETWRFLCNRILNSSELARWADASSLDSAVTEVVEEMVFAGLTDEWPHASLFRDLIEKWVAVIGRNPDAYPSLVQFLRGPGSDFVPDPALEWISRCVPTSSTQKQRFWQAHSNAERTARLLRSMWDHAAESMRSQSTMLKRYADLIDQLVGVGIPLASILQQELEQRQ
jgi:hypothetical protein